MASPDSDTATSTLGRSSSSKETGSASRATASSTASATNAASASDRRAKKREQDRRCQRLARARTKNRINYLESLLADFQQQDTSAQLRTLLKERDEAVADRDRLIQSLRTINRVVQTSHSLLATAAGKAIFHQDQGHQQLTPPKDEAKTSDDGHVLDEEEDAEHDQDSPAHDVVNSGAPSVSAAATATAAAASQLGEGMAETIWCTNDISAIPACDSDAFAATHSDIVSMTSAIVGPLDQTWPVPSEDTQSTPHATTQPFSPHNCDCLPGASSTASLSRPFNNWRFANEILSKPIPWSSEISEIEDALAEDIPVRAVADGWDAAAQSVGGTLPPSWQQLRQIDQVLFSTMNKVERLAIMNTMHSMLVARADATLERRSRLPDWYIARPSQTIAHSVATDYFSWPGVRERFVFHPHRYCTNRFWAVFNKNFHIIWPFEFRDCYTRSIQTGRYNISPTFSERIKDIRTFTMGEEMFEIWPEFRSDIPKYHGGVGVGVPMALNLPANMDFVHGHGHGHAHRSGKGTGRNPGQGQQKALQFGDARKDGENSADDGRAGEDGVVRHVDVDLHHPSSSTQEHHSFHALLGGQISNQFWAFSNSC